MPKARDIFGPRLSWLFQNVKKIDETGKEKRWTSKEVADAIGVSDNYLRKLKAQMARNPSIDLVERIAEFFGVDVTFFFDKTEADLKTLYLANKISSDPLLESIALRASTLDGVDREVVDEMLKAIVKIRQEKEQQLKSSD